MLKTSGVVSVCQSLHSLSSLKEFGIQSTEATETAAEAIASVISSNNNITNLYLAGNKLQDKAVTIMKALRAVSSVVFLHLNHMEMTETVTTDLVMAINNNPLLEKLYIACNLLSSGLIEIVKACKKSLINLPALDLQYNPMDPSLLVELASVTGTINTLEALSIGGLAVSLDETIFNNFSLNVCLVCNSKCDIHLIEKYMIIEILNYELQRQTICEVVKINYDLNYLSLTCADPMIRDYPQLTAKSKCFNMSLQNAKQKLLQVDAASVIYLLPIISKLKVLNLEQSNVDEIAAFELAGILGCNDVLEKLWLGSNQLGTAGAMFILNSLGSIVTLKTLDLSFNDIGSQSAEGIAAVIHNNPLLEQLWLDGNKLMDVGVTHICHALKCITKLRILSLYSNGITDDTADELSNVIFANNLLQDLSLGINKLQSGGICKIAHALNKLCKLRKLDLFHTSVTKLAAQGLAVMISNSYSLQELYLSDNMLETEGAIKIFESLKHKSKLQVLTLSNNDITDETIDELCLVLAQNPRLQVLLLGGNKLQTDGVVRIAQVVKRENTIMRLLVLCENNVSEQGKEEVEKICSDNTLIHIYI
ncbi:ribonuclease inhibitor-like [Dysidea avara]|uniref:ribonuclease inhibitor-like n=1 Tax=Dysidea avara TaxID=196820 RepID=UPI00332624B3